MKNKTVLLALSGGVDSSVSALILKNQGYKVTCAFMKNFSKRKNKIIGECNWKADKKDAQKIAKLLNLPLIILNFEKQYLEQVINPMFKSYSLGLTPNPDSLCNKIIKFPLLWKEAKRLNINYIATGHYARISKSKHWLLKAKDKKKDQTYFLYDLKESDLSHTLFPIGNLTKDKVRQIAKKHNLPNYNKKGTSGICFIGNINVKSFLKQKIKSRVGKIKNPEGETIGEHNGIMFYTIGERIGERFGFKINKDYVNKTKKKLYVADKIKKSNILIVAPENHPSLLKKEFFIKKINFISEKPKTPLKAKVRIRHLGELIPSKITLKGGKYLCTLKKPVKGLAEGQSAVIYKGKIVLGGGEIRNS